MKENTTATRRAAMGALATVGAASASGASCAQSSRRLRPAAAGSAVRLALVLRQDPDGRVLRGHQGHGYPRYGPRRPDDWDAVLKNRVEVALSTGPATSRTLNDPANHERLIAGAEKMLEPRSAAPHMVVFRNRKDADDQGLKNCAAGLKQILPVAEKAGVTVIMELLNSKRNHKDYMCDRTLGRELRGPRREELALRRLPHADHGGRRHRHHPRVPPRHRALPHRGVPPPRDRRAVSELAASARPSPKPFTDGWPTSFAHLTR